MSYTYQDELDAVQLVRESLKRANEIGMQIRSSRDSLSRGAPSTIETAARAVTALAEAQSAQTQLALAAITFHLQVQTELRSKP